MKQKFSLDFDEGDPAGFTHGFLKWLEDNKVESGLIHGWKDDFNNKAGDVDIVVSHAAFKDITGMVHKYCMLAEWQMCQVLRHESTAAFYVCSWMRDPSVVVAFDICSDYRRRERVLICADELLKGRVPIPGGGSRLSSANELRYLFIKGAIKGKNPSDMISSLSDYSESTRRKCSEWITARWGVDIEDWTEDSVSAVWIKLDEITLHEPVDGIWRALQRIIHRLSKPTGLILVCRNRTDIINETFRAFQRLYFRSNHKLPHWSFKKLPGLIRSSLYGVPQLGSVWKFLLGNNLWIEVKSGESSKDFHQRLADFLAHRCVSREGIQIE